MPAVLVAVIALLQCFFSPLHTTLLCPLLLSSTPFLHSSSLLSSAHITSFLPPFSPSPTDLLLIFHFWTVISLGTWTKDIGILRSNSLTAFKRHLTTIDFPSWFKSETLRHKPPFLTLLQPPLSSSTPSLFSLAVTSPFCLIHLLFFLSFFVSFHAPFLPSDFLLYPLPACLHPTTPVSIIPISSLPVLYPWGNSNMSLPPLGLLPYLSHSLSSCFAFFTTALIT